MKTRALGLALCLLTAPAFAQDFAKSFDVTEIVPGIYMLVGANGKWCGPGRSLGSFAAMIRPWL